jgi:predicted MPP superfamily phosphohydrolase
MDRRSFLKSSLAAAVPVSPLMAASYGLYEAGSVRIERPAIALPNLPASFDELRIAFLTDIHHGPYISLDYVVSIVRTTLALGPDLILLGGDYVSLDAKYVEPCFEVLAGLKSPLGVFGVLGNHDHRHGLAETKAAFSAAGIEELTNRGVWLRRASSRLRLGGVDDLWYGQPDVKPALADAAQADACLIVSHNPDFAEKMWDSRVGLILSGHTHGGQVYVPGYGAPIVPSRYGQKYLQGLVQAPRTQVYISRGLGTVTPPIRYNSHPEITLMTLNTE